MRLYSGEHYRWAGRHSTGSSSCVLHLVDTDHMLAFLKGRLPELYTRCNLTLKPHYFQIVASPDQTCVDCAKHALPEPPPLSAVPAGASWVIVLAGLLVGLLALYAIIYGVMK